MKKLLPVSIVLFIFLSDCSLLLLGVDTDFLNDRNVYVLPRKEIDEKYGFDRLLMMNLIVIDNTGTFNTNYLVNIHFDNKNSSVFPREEKWIHEESYNKFEGILLAQAKYDQIQIDLVSFGTSQSRAGSAYYPSTITTKVLYFDINGIFSTKKAHLNHLGTLVLTLDSVEKIGVEYRYKIKVQKSDVFVQINFLKPTEEIFEENLLSLKKYSPEIHKAFINSINKCY